MKTNTAAASTTTPSMTDASDHERGIAIFNAMLPDMPEKLKTALGPVAPDMVRFIIDVAGGCVIARPQLDLQSREVATIAVLAAMGNAAPQLAVHIRGGLACGLTPQQVVDVIYLVAVFAGFPAALNAIAVAGEVFATHTPDFTPKEETLSPEEKRRRGLKTLHATSGEAGTNVLRAMQGTIPLLADLLVDFSYGEVIGRPALSAEHKEIAMIAASCGRGGMLPQLKVHVQAALNVGMTQEAILELLVQMAIYAGFPAALNGITAAREVFDQQKR
ncbi:carboxymuconolactone decarboxylase family protein [Desulfovibrio mangrovi]|uniref:carboxymuconolactone decarboxylase family protein n=1 Tax=Desulfovibrio mangrovi TaxID=2976983 RepID=UPI002245FD72|nr:carboxymuconolactone decarboxylase family protein [Desulfovibrio mangrovi]UZP67459.1 carboxymuconolactone decarboxylase family protein [Desulfovibrio mangrovi]